jgi:outer membrane lipoprotein SlyB
MDAILYRRTQGNRYMLTHCKYAALLTALTLAGCQTTGEEYQADVFDASQVNTRQQARTVKIITVTPTKIKVSNEANRKAATVVGGLLGVIGGAAIGAGRSHEGALVGAVGGGAAGALAGSMVNDTSLVPGVLIGYSENGTVYTSAQVGRACQFSTESVSLIVTMLNDETRIQPNATCPPATKG